MFLFIYLFIYLFIFVRLVSVPTPDVEISPAAGEALLFLMIFLTLNVENVC